MWVWNIQKLTENEIISYFLYKSCPWYVGVNYPETDWICVHFLEKVMWFLLKGALSLLAVQVHLWSRRLGLIWIFEYTIIGNTNISADRLQNIQVFEHILILVYIQILWHTLSISIYIVFQHSFMSYIEGMSFCVFKVRFFQICQLHYIQEFQHTWLCWRAP